MRSVDNWYRAWSAWQQCLIGKRVCLVGVLALLCVPGYALAEGYYYSVSVDASPISQVTTAAFSFNFWSPNILAPSLNSPIEVTSEPAFTFIGTPQVGFKLASIIFTNNGTNNYFIVTLVNSGNGDSLIVPIIPLPRSLVSTPGTYPLWMCPNLIIPGKPYTIVGIEGTGSLSVVTSTGAGATQQTALQPLCSICIKPGPPGTNYFVYSQIQVPSGLWFDPPTASAFEYTMTSYSLFTSILNFPIGFSSPFTVSTGGVVLGTFSPGQSLTFPNGGVSDFTVSGISPSVDPSNTRSFPLQLTFNTATASFTQQTPPRCVPTSTTLCIDDQPGDKRFQIQTTVSTTEGGGLDGLASDIPLSTLGISQGGMFWFFAATNPEMLVKVINGCSLGGHYWVFIAALTNVGFSVTVTDTLTGNSKTYTNPDHTTAAPVQDTSALPCT